MLHITLKVGESINIGDMAIVTLSEKEGQAAKLSIDADRAIAVTRVAKKNTAAQIAAAGGITGKP